MVQPKKMPGFWGNFIVAELTSPTVIADALFPERFTPLRSISLFLCFMRVELLDPVGVLAFVIVWAMTDF
jgi:hypothetical protein